MEAQRYRIEYDQDMAWLEYGAKAMLTDLAMQDSALKAKSALLAENEMTALSAQHAKIRSKQVRKSFSIFTIAFNSAAPRSNPTVLVLPGRLTILVHFQ